MVSAKEKSDMDNILNDLAKPQPIMVEAPPDCYQDEKTYRKDRLDCILCDFFDTCRK